LFFVLVLFRLLGLAAAFVLARHRCLRSFTSVVGACGSAIGSKERWVLQADRGRSCSPCSSPDQIATIDPGSGRWPELRAPLFAAVNVAVLVSGVAFDGKAGGTAPRRAPRRRLCPPGPMVDGDLSVLAILPYSVCCWRVLTMASATALIASATARVAWTCALANSAGSASVT
jgi:hypothetical protein